MQTKRIIIITLLISIVLNFLIPISLAENLADVEAPIINIDSLKIDKTEATIGDIVTVSFEIADNREIQYACIDYETPITHKNKSCKLTKNTSIGKYEAKIVIDENCEEGLWKIIKIQTLYSASNNKSIYNSKGKFADQTPQKDLSKGDFIVTGTNADIEAPNINAESLKADKSEVIVGDSVTISLEITDNISIKDAFIYYKMPITKNSKSFRLTKNNDTGKYETKIKIDESFEEGIWKVYEILAIDNASNIQQMFNTKVSYGKLNPDEDLSKGNFRVFKDPKTFTNDALGDVNKDGKITLADYTKVLAHVKKTKMLE